MDNNKPLQQQIGRERAAYRYLEAMDAGDIDAVIEVLQQAVYDAPLENMVLDAHQAYFQAEQQREAEQIMELDTQFELPTIENVPPRPRGWTAPKHRRSRWAQTLAAVLIIGVLVGGFVTLLTFHNLGSNQTGVSPDRCVPFSWKQFDGSPYAGSLAAVVTVSANDAWAVGSAGDSVTAVIEHWNGTGWQEVSSPKVDHANSSLGDIAAVSANDIWAAGYSWPAPSNAGSSTAVKNARALIEHWDGIAWKIVTSPNGPGGNAVLNRLTVISATNIWAAGSFEDTNSLDHPFLEHWDGRSWQAVQFQGDSASVVGLLNDIAGTSQNDIWVAGLGRSPNEPRAHGLLGHWDGNQWQWVPTPSGLGDISSIGIISPTTVLVASYDESDGKPLLERWNDQQWSKVTLPDSVDGLTSLAVVSADNIWAIGTTPGHNLNAHQVLVLHWDGKRWQTLSEPEPFPDVDEVPASISIAQGQTWIVGYLGEENHLALILGQRTCS